jgi:predicted RNase H-like nuclease (RuvC/YqgF family)
MNCQYCNKTLADLKSLLKHQKQTKYCLEKQKDKEEKDKEINLLKNQLKEKDDQINLLKNQLKEKDDEIELLKNQLKEKETKVEIEQNFDFDQIQNIIKEYCKN